MLIFFFPGLKRDLFVCQYETIVSSKTLFDDERADDASCRSVLQVLCALLSPQSLSLCVYTATLMTAVVFTVVTGSSQQRYLLLEVFTLMAKKMSVSSHRNCKRLHTFCICASICIDGIGYYCKVWLRLGNMIL